MAACGFRRTWLSSAASNFDYDDLLRVPLTSIDQDSEGLGLNAGKLAIGLTKRKPKASRKNLLMRVKLVVRASSRR